MSSTISPRWWWLLEDHWDLVIKVNKEKQIFMSLFKIFSSRSWWSMIHLGTKLVSPVDTSLVYCWTLNWTLTLTVLEIKHKPVTETRVFFQIRNPNLSGRLNPNPNPNLWIFTNPKPNPTCIANWTRTQTRTCSHNKVESKPKPKPVKFLSSKLQPNLWTKLNPKPTQICTGWVGFHFGSD